MNPGFGSHDAPASETDAYENLILYLDRHGARYRLIDHDPEGRTEVVSAIRGHDPSLAAKCMVVMVKVGRKETRYVLAVVPGHVRVDLARVRALYGGRYASIASAEVAERLAGCVAGTILPFSFHTELGLVADPSLLASNELYFNAARLDRSIALATSDYQRLAQARWERIAQG